MNGCWVVYVYRICIGMNLANQALFIDIASLLWAATIEKAIDADGKPIIPSRTDCVDEGLVVYVDHFFSLRYLNWPIHIFLVDRCHSSVLSNLVAATSCLWLSKRCTRRRPNAQLRMIVILTYDTESRWFYYTTSTLLCICISTLSLYISFISWLLLVLGTLRHFER